MSARLRVGLIGSGDNNTNTLLRLLVEQGIHIVYTLTPKDISDAHINEKHLDVWLLDLDDAHWHNNLDELMDHSNVPIFFNEHQSVEQQSHVEYWVRNLISRMEELADDIEMPIAPSTTVEKAAENATAKNTASDKTETMGGSSSAADIAKDKPESRVTAANLEASARVTSASLSAKSVSTADANQPAVGAAKPLTTSATEQASSTSKNKTAEMHHIAFNAPPALPSDQLTPMPTKVDEDLLREMEELESFLLDKDPAAKVDSFKPLEPIRLQIAPSSQSSTLDASKAESLTLEPAVESQSAVTTQTTEPTTDSVAAMPSSVSVSATTNAETQAAELAKTSNERKSEPASVEAKTQDPVKPQPTIVDATRTVSAQTSTSKEEPLKSTSTKESIEDLLKAAKTELRGQMAPPSVRSERPAQSPSKLESIAKVEAVETLTVKPSASVTTDKRQASLADAPVDSESNAIVRAEKRQTPQREGSKNSETAFTKRVPAQSILAESVLNEPVLVKPSSDHPSKTSSLPTPAEIARSRNEAKDSSTPSQEQIVLPTFELDLGFIDESVIDQRLSDGEETSSAPDANIGLVKATLEVTPDSIATQESKIAFDLPSMDEEYIPALAMDAAVDISYESVDDIGAESHTENEFALPPTLERTDLVTEEFDAIEFEPVEPEFAQSHVQTREDQTLETPGETTPNAAHGTTQREEQNTAQREASTLTSSPMDEEILPEIELIVPMLESVAMGAEFEELAAFTPDETPIIAQKKLPCDLWIVGASLGGPAALKRFFGSISEPLPVCFLIAQHIDPHFLPVLGKIVEGANPFYKVEVLTRPGLIEPGTILLAPVEKRLWFLDGAQVVHSPHSWTPPYSPSINDVLLDVAKAYPSQTHTVIFSGMGEDGVDGAKSIHQAGGHVWVQESESCASAVMPDAIFNTGIVSLRDTPEKLAQALMKRYLDKSQSQHG